MDQTMHRLVHLDLKGAAPTMQYLEELLPLLQRLGATGLLVEYEDMFPYWGSLESLRTKFAYSKEDVARLHELASTHGLIVIPLVQTFGHFEFVLKHPQFAHLREMPDMPMALCPSNSDSFQVVCEMLRQVMELHPTVRWFHIGCDEVYHIGCCARCRELIGEDSAGSIQLFYSHVKAVGQFVRSCRDNLMPIIWDDMLRLREADELRASGLGSVVEIMVWHYLPVFQLPVDLWVRLSAAFPAVWFASAFKGATSACAVFTDITHHVTNHLAWLSVLQLEATRFKHIRGVAITGWQRFDHFAVLCELLPEALPCLAVCLQILQHKEWTAPIHCQASKLLKFSGLIPTDTPLRQAPPECDFPGSDVYVCMLEFAALALDFRENFHGDKVFTWTNPYLLSKLHCNPLHVESILSYLYHLLMRFASMRMRLVVALEAVFFPDCVAEWLGVYLDPKVKQLETLAVQAEAFLKTARKVMTLTPPDSTASAACKDGEDGEEERKMPWSTVVCLNTNNSQTQVMDGLQKVASADAVSSDRATTHDGKDVDTNNVDAAANDLDVDSSTNSVVNPGTDADMAMSGQITPPQTSEAERVPGIENSPSTAISRPTASLTLHSP